MDWMFKSIQPKRPPRFNTKGKKLISDLQKGDKIVFEYGDFDNFISMEVDHANGRHVFGTILSTDLTITTVGNYEDVDFITDSYVDILEA